jgi:hypothetical protein
MLKDLCNRVNRVHPGIVARNIGSATWDIAQLKLDREAGIDHALKPERAVVRRMRLYVGGIARANPSKWAQLHGCAHCPPQLALAHGRHWMTDQPVDLMVTAVAASLISNGLTVICRFATSARLWDWDSGRAA